jgi:hypothetical protein
MKLIGCDTLVLCATVGNRDRAIAVADLQLGTPRCPNRDRADLLRILN